MFHLGTQSLFTKRFRIAMIAIIDYGMGNVRSIRNALLFLGEEAEVTSDKKVLNRALILPGVGLFLMRWLHNDLGALMSWFLGKTLTLASAWACS